MAKAPALRQRSPSSPWTLQPPRASAAYRAAPNAHPAARAETNADSRAMQGPESQNRQDPHARRGRNPQRFPPARRPEGSAPAVRRAGPERGPSCPPSHRSPTVPKRTPWEAPAGPAGSARKRRHRPRFGRARAAYRRGSSAAGPRQRPKPPPPEAKRETAPVGARSRPPSGRPQRLCQPSMG